jgi:hypothetical protein
MRGSPKSPLLLRPSVAAEAKSTGDIDVMTLLHVLLIQKTIEPIEEH